MNFINNHGYIRTLLSELVMVRSCDEGEESPMWAARAILSSAPFLNRGFACEKAYNENQVLKFSNWIVNLSYNDSYSSNGKSNYHI